MAVVADSDGLDLWVEPHEWTAEEREEVERFVEERRGQGTGPQFAENIARLLARVRAASSSPSPPAADITGPPNQQAADKT
jgi:hypothetical protein